MNIEDANKDPTVLKFREKMKKKTEKAWNSKMAWARTHYINIKWHGIRDYYVPEWDEYEIEYYTKKIKDMEKENNNMEFKATVRLSRDYQVVELGVEKVETLEELAHYEGILRSKAEILLNSVTGNPKPVTPKETYTKTNYPETVVSNIPQGKVTARDVTTKFLKGKQVDHAVKCINSDKSPLTLARVNSFTSWDDSQTYLYTEDNKNNVIFAK